MLGVEREAKWGWDEDGALGIWGGKRQPRRSEERWQAAAGDDYGSQVEPLAMLQFPSLASSLDRSLTWLPLRLDTCGAL